MEDPTLGEDWGERCGGEGWRGDGGMSGMGDGGKEETEGRGEMEAEELERSTVVRVSIHVARQVQLLHLSCM